MTIKVKKINDIEVKKVKLSNQINPKEILGYNLFKKIFSNIWLCSKKHSGKSTVIANILDKCINKSTIVVFFCPTINKDETYIKMKKKLKKRGIMYDAYEDIFDEEGGNIVDKYLHMLIERERENQEEDDEEQEEIETIEEYRGLIKFNEEPPKEKKKKEEEPKIKKNKIRSPDYIFIFDDLGEALKHKSIYRLLSKNRHFNCKVILSTQSPNDLAGRSRKQIEYSLIFRSFDREQLKELYRALDLSVNIEDFYKLYDYATLNPYNFLYISNDNEFRKNFNQRLEIIHN